VIELRFAEDLYDGFAVDEAAKIYGGYGTIELSRAEGAYVVRVRGNDGVDDRTLAAELANFALGLTVDAQGSGSASGPAPRTPSDKAHGAEGAS
jgi:hypothetical protein